MAYFSWGELDSDETVDELIEGLNNLSRQNLLAFTVSIIFQSGFEMEEIEDALRTLDEQYFPSKED